MVDTNLGTKLITAYMRVPVQKKKKCRADELSTDKTKQYKM